MPRQRAQGGDRLRRMVRVAKVGQALNSRFTSFFGEIVPGTFIEGLVVAHAFRLLLVPVHCPVLSCRGERGSRANLSDTLISSTHWGDWGSDLRLDAFSEPHT